MSQLKQTPSQTVGPFFAYGLTPTQYGYDLKSLFTPVLAQPNAQGEHIRITGQVFDGAGNAVMPGGVGATGGCVCRLRAWWLLGRP